MPNIGQIYRVRNWDHHQGTGREGVRFTLGLGRQSRTTKTVVIMAVLGEEPFDEESFDIEAALNRMGWFKKEETDAKEN